MIRANVSVRAGAVARRMHGSAVRFCSGVRNDSIVSAQRQKGVVKSTYRPSCRLRSRRSRRPVRSTRFIIGVDISAQIAHTGDAAGRDLSARARCQATTERYSSSADTLYAPDFAGHGGTASGGIGSYTAFTPISQSAVSGTGTSGKSVHGHDRRPRRRDRTLRSRRSTATSSDRSRIAPTSPSRTPATRRSTAILYRAIRLLSRRIGFGLRHVERHRGPAARQNPNNVPAGRIEQIVPLNGGNNYYESFYGSVWAADRHAPAVPEHLRLRDPRGQRRRASAGTSRCPPAAASRART